MGGDEGEFHNTRNFTYFSRVVRNVRRMNNVYSRIKKKKEWGIDPDFVQLNPSFESWMNDLPAAFILLPEYHHAPPTSTYLHGANEHRWGLEASYDDLLLVSKTTMQAARGHPAILWHDWAPLHAERYKLYDLLRTNLHCSSSGMYLCGGIMSYPTTLLNIK
jgi:hypothetical protein